MQEAIVDRCSVKKVLQKFRKLHRKNTCGVVSINKVAGLS